MKQETTIQLFGIRRCAPKSTRNRHRDSRSRRFIAASAATGWILALLATAALLAR